MGNSLVIVGNIGEHLRSLALLPEMHLLRDFSWLQASPCWCPYEEMTADFFQTSRNDAECTCLKTLCFLNYMIKFLLPIRWKKHRNELLNYWRLEGVVSSSSS